MTIGLTLAAHWCLDHAYFMIFEQYSDIYIVNILIWAISMASSFSFSMALVGMLYEKVTAEKK
jgi:hypothetical protein